MSPAHGRAMCLQLQQSMTEVAGFDNHRAAAALIAFARGDRRGGYRGQRSSAAKNLSIMGRVQYCRRRVKGILKTPAWCRIGLDLVRPMLRFATIHADADVDGCCKFHYSGAYLVVSISGKGQGVDAHCPVPNGHTNVIGRGGAGGPGAGVAG